MSAINIVCHTYLHHPLWDQHFFALPQLIYAQDPHYIPYHYEKEREVFNPQNPLLENVQYQKFLLMDTDLSQPLARCVACLNPDIKENKIPLGQFGLFESLTEDPVILNLLMDKVEEWLRHKGAKKIAGPMTLTTWYPYRFKTDHFDAPPYLFEPYHRAFYPQYFIKRGYLPLASYSTSEIEISRTTPLLPPKLPMELNLHVRNISLGEKKFQKDIQDIYQLVIQSFADNFLYSPISKSDFLKLYRNLKPFIQKNFFCLIRNKDGLLVGFIFSIPNYVQALQKLGASGGGRIIKMIRALRFLHYKKKADSLLLKTMAVHPDYRRFRLGAFLIAKMHYEAKKKKIYQVKHCLMIENNFSNRYSKNCHLTVNRNYQLLSQEL